MTIKTSKAAVSVKDRLQFSTMVCSSSSSIESWSVVITQAKKKDSRSRRVVNWIELARYPSRRPSSHTTHNSRNFRNKRRRRAHKHLTLPRFNPRRFILLRRRPYERRERPRLIHRLWVQFPIPRHDCRPFLHRRFLPARLHRLGLLIHRHRAFESRHRIRVHLRRCRRRRGAFFILSSIRAATSTETKDGCANRRRRRPPAA